MREQRVIFHIHLSSSAIKAWSFFSRIYREKKKNNNTEDEMMQTPSSESFHISHQLQIETTSTTESESKIIKNKKKNCKYVTTTPRCSRSDSPLGTWRALLWTDSCGTKATVSDSHIHRRREKKNPKQNRTVLKRGCLDSTWFGSIHTFYKHKPIAASVSPAARLQQHRGHIHPQKWAPWGGWVRREEGGGAAAAADTLLT